MKLFDAHSHLQGSEAYERALDAGVEGIVVCGTSPKDWEEVLSSGDCGLPIFPMIGIHPWFVPACGGSEKAMQRLEQLLRKYPRAGIGETGLDFQKKFSNRKEQAVHFAEHLDLARELNRPVAVHSVHAWGRLIDILKDHPVPAGIILHAFSGSAEVVSELTKLNCWFSFCGVVTNPKAAQVRAAVMAVSEDRLLVETDSPDFPPTGCFPPNESANLVYVAKAVAELRGVSVEKIACIASYNAKKLFL